MVENVKILIVEDSSTQALRLRLMLEDRGYNVTVASSGEEAVSCLDGLRPDLVITDIIMPGMDGYELCRWIKANEELGGIPVILLTQLSNPKDVVLGLECEADNFISKPYDEEYLVGRIKNILLNNELRKNSAPAFGIDVVFSGQKYHLTAERLQIIDFLLATYETAVMKNDELAREIAERIRIERELEKTNAELKGFAHTVSHDLKGPVSALKMASGIIQDVLGQEMTPANLETIIELGGMIDSSTTKAAELIDEILSLAEAGQVPKEVSDVDVGAVVRSIIKERAGQMAERGVRVELGDDLGRIRANPTHVYQVFTNLISNAIKHGDSAEPLIEVTHSFDEEAGVHRYLVRDNGSGVPPEELDNILVPFFKGKTGETGLGLAIVDRIIKVYGGDILIYNDDGACFEFVMKDYEADAASPASTGE